jgi:hypothetical protein
MQHNAKIAYTLVRARVVFGNFAHNTFTDLVFVLNKKTQHRSRRRSLGFLLEKAQQGFVW